MNVADDFQLRKTLDNRAIYSEEAVIALLANRSEGNLEIEQEVSDVEHSVVLTLDNRPIEAEYYGDRKYEKEGESKHLGTDSQPFPFWHGL